jgi:hypothetical protein
MDLLLDIPMGGILLILNSMTLIKMRLFGEKNLALTLGVTVCTGFPLSFYTDNLSGSTGKLEKIFWWGVTTGGGNFPAGFAGMYQRH